MSDLISQMPCSHTKARHLIEEAVELGYAEMGAMETDRRVEIVTPTQRTIEIWERHFANWTMGKVHIDAVNGAALLKYSENAELAPFNAPGRATLALLIELASTGCIANRG